MISTSPLCPHIEQGSGADWLRALPVKPKAVKVFSSGPARELKTIHPDIITIKRRWVPDQDAYLSQGAQGGRRFVREQPDLEGVDILEGLNECVPAGSPDAIRRANDFHLGFIEECTKRGVTPCILNIATGNPEVIRNGQPYSGEVKLLVPCVQAVVDTGGYVGYHGYGPMHILQDEDWHSFRDILRIEPLLRESGVTGRIKWLHTEAGFDSVNTPAPSGPWKTLVAQGHISLLGICDEYAAYARRCLQLGVEIACIYTFWGTPQWHNYEHADVPELLNWFAQHWEENMNQTPKIVYAAPGKGYTAINLRDAQGNDIADVPRGTPLTVIGTADIPGIGPGYRIEALVAQSVTSTTPPKMKTTIPQPEVWMPLRYPILDATKIEITDKGSFGSKRDYGPHEGLDLRTITPISPDGIGARITPMLKGVVNRIGNSPSGYGKYIVISSTLQHNGETEVWDAYYAHLSAVRVKVGELVTPGDVIGESGSTGNSTGAHCHVTLRKRGFKSPLIVEGACDFTKQLFIPQKRG